MDATADWDNEMHFNLESTFDYSMGSASGDTEKQLQFDMSPIVQTQQMQPMPVTPLGHSSDPSSSSHTSPSTPGEPPNHIPDQDKGTLVSVSTTFYPGSNNDPTPTDLVLLSTDCVFFYVHFQKLLAASDNCFNRLLLTPRQETFNNDHEHANGLSDVIITLHESSAVLNVVLHAIYDLSCAHYSPSLEILSAAVDALKVYGVSLQKVLSPPSPLHNILLSHAPTSPLEVYALAASYDLYDLAVSTSPHLLSFSLPSLTDEMAQKIGPVYLKKLFFLHLGRADALKRLLLPPPHPHAPTSKCDFAEQKKLTRAWALASAYLAWDARPDMSTSAMESALVPLGEHLRCELCQEGLKDRIKNLVVQWSVVKRTI